MDTGMFATDSFTLFFFEVLVSLKHSPSRQNINLCTLKKSNLSRLNVVKIVLTIFFQQNSQPRSTQKMLNLKALCHFSIFHGLDWLAIGGQWGFNSLYHKTDVGALRQYSLFHDIWTLSGWTISGGYKHKVLNPISLEKKRIKSYLGSLLSCKIHF